MANVWELITDSSSLPVQAGNNLWNHLNALGGGVGVGSFIASELEIEIMELGVEIESGIEVEMQEPIEIEIDNEISVELC